MVKLVTTNINKLALKSLTFICPIQNKFLDKKIFQTFQNSDALLTDILLFITFVFTHVFKCLEAKFLN